MQMGFWGEVLVITTMSNTQISYEMEMMLSLSIRLGKCLAVWILDVFSPWKGGYIDFGEATDGVNGLKATGWTAAGILALPITDNFAPYAKAGQLFWNSDSLVGSITVSEDGNDYFYGAGIRYALYQRLDLRLEYERFTMDHGNDEIDMDMASLNMQLRF